MSRFFVNYRTGDETFAAVKLAECLAARFGEDNIFRDSRSIPIGVNFEPVLWRNLRESTALIVVIGPRWHTGAGTTNRLADPGDFVRREIEFAFQLDLPVIPVLVGSVSALRADDLPPSIRSLADMQYLRISARSADRDLKDLVEQVARQYGAASSDPRTGAGITVLVTPASGPLPGNAAEQVERVLSPAGVRARQVEVSNDVIHVVHDDTTSTGWLLGDMPRLLTDSLDADVRWRVAVTRGPADEARLLLEDRVLHDALTATGPARLGLICTEEVYRLATRPGQHSFDRAAFAPVTLDSGRSVRVHIPGSPRPRGLPRPASASRPDRSAGDRRRGDRAAGDWVAGDKVAGDKVMGDKVMGDKTVYGS